MSEEGRVRRRGRRNNNDDAQQGTTIGSDENKGEVEENVNMLDETINFDLPPRKEFAAPERKRGNSIENFDRSTPRSKLVLEKLRSKGGSRQNLVELANKEVEDGANSNSRRMELLSQRQQSRARRDSENKEVQDGTKEESHHEKKHEPKSAQEDLSPKTTIELAPQVFPLQITPSFPSTIRGQNPLLFIPQSVPNCSCGESSCLNPLYSNDDLVEEGSWNGAVEFKSSPAEEDYTLFENNFLGKEGRECGSINLWSEHTSLLNNPVASKDGIFTSNNPFFLSLLFSHVHKNGDVVDKYIDFNNVHLSRATNRILRDCFYAKQENIKRKAWMDLTKKPLDEGKKLKYSGVATWASDLETFRSDDNIYGGSDLLSTKKSEVPQLKCFEEFENRNLIQPTKQLISDITKNNMLNSGATSIDDALDNDAAQSRTLTSLISKGATLKILIKEICLINHPYMSEEEVAFNELKALYLNYCGVFQNNAADFLATRIVNIAEQLQSLVKDSSIDSFSFSNDDEMKLHLLYIDVIETLPALCSLKEMMDKLTNDLYASWSNLKAIRKKQGFVSTRANLVARKVEIKESRDSKGNEKNDEKLKVSGSEGVESSKIWRHCQKNLKNLPNLVKSVQKYFNQKRTSALKASVGDEDSLAKNYYLNKEKPSNDDQEVRVLEVIENAVEFLNECEILLPTVMFRLTATGNITPDNQVSAIELARREKLKRLLIHFQLKVNGQALAVSEKVEFQWPSLKADFNSLFELRVVEEPSDILLELFYSYKPKNNCLSCSVFMSDVPIASIGIPLPQQKQLKSRSGTVSTPTFTIVPTIDWYAFCSQNMIVASRGRGTSEDNPTSSVRFEGSVLCGSQYDVGYDQPHESIMQRDSFDGVSLGNAAWINEYSNPKDARMADAKTFETRGRLAGDILQFTKEKDFFDLLPQVNDIDINDPRNDGLVRQIRSGLLSGRNTQRDIFQLFGAQFTVMYGEENTDYSNFLRFQLNDRMKLLKLRDSRPYLFTEPIPLQQSAIRKNEVLRNILAREEREADEFKAGGTSSLHHALKRAESDGIIDAADEDRIANESKKTSFIEQIRNSSLASSRKSRRKKVLTSSVVYDPNDVYFDDFSWSKIFASDGLLKPRRSLKPSPAERIPEAKPTKKCELLIQIVGCKNVPIRKHVAHVGFGSSSRSLLTKSTSVGVKSLSGKAAPLRASYSSKLGGFGSDDDEESAANLLGDLESSMVDEKKKVTTFVEVSFQDKTAKTTVAEGPNPSWKQSLSLPFFPPQGDFSHSNLEKIDDHVFITLYDEIIYDDEHRGGFLPGESSVRTERFYIGSFTIPFSIIYTQKTVMGTFRLNTPPINFGYTFNSRHSHSKKLSGPTSPNVTPSSPVSIFSCFQSCFSRNTLPDSAVDSAIGVYIDQETLNEFDWFCCGSSFNSNISILSTLDPLLTSTPYIDSDISISTTYPADRPLVPYAQAWMKSLREYSEFTKNRKYMIFGTNSEGLSVLVCRYLRPQTPPVNMTSRRSCLHLVSMIPFLEDSKVFVGETDLWCTNKQLWEIAAGDEDDHAVCLYNMLYYLSVRDVQDHNSNKNNNVQQYYPGYPSEEFVLSEELFLILGTAIPEGQSVFILVRRGGRSRGADKKQNDTSPKSFLIINPCTGFIYSAADPNCPLIEIACLATPYNIWANVQPSAKPDKMNFDISKTNLWKPLFGAFRAPIAGLSTIQEPVQYTPTSSIRCLEIEKILKASIKSNLRKWRSVRPKAVTSFHADACAILTDLLADLEEWKANGTMGSTLGLGSDASKSHVHSAKVSIGSRQQVIEHAASDILHALEQQVTFKMKNILQTRTFSGFPINLPFTDTNTVMNVIKSTCIHETKHPDVQFVFAVRAFPLVNNIVSLWIFLGTLESTK